MRGGALCGGVGGGGGVRRLAFIVGWASNDGGDHLQALPKYLSAATVSLSIASAVWVCGDV